MTYAEDAASMDDVDTETPVFFIASLKLAGTAAVAGRDEALVVPVVPGGRDVAAAEANKANAASFSSAGVDVAELARSNLIKRRFFNGKCSCCVLKVHDGR